jgi:hypothetical protein
MIFLYLRELELKTDQSPLFFFLYLFLGCCLKWVAMGYPGGVYIIG